VSKVNLAIVVYAVVQTLVIAEVYACRTLGADWMCLVHLATVEAYASGSLGTVGSVPTAVVDRMHTVCEHAAVAAYYFANCSAVLRKSAQSVYQGVVSVLREVVEVGKSPDLSPAAVDQGMCSAEPIGGTVHPL